MKDDEKTFFKICVKHRCDPVWSVNIRSIIKILYECGFMHYKRCWYLLEKWDGLGFYNYGVTMDLGWFELDKLPARYAVLLMEEKE